MTGGEGSAAEPVAEPAGVEVSETGAAVAEEKLPAMASVLISCVGVFKVFWAGIAIGCGAAGLLALTGKIDTTTSFASDDFRSTVPRFSEENLKANPALIDAIGALVNDARCRESSCLFKRASRAA